MPYIYIHCILYVMKLFFWTTLPTTVVSRLYISLLTSTQRWCFSPLSPLASLLQAWPHQLAVLVDPCASSSCKQSVAEQFYTAKCCCVDQHFSQRLKDYMQARCVKPNYQINRIDIKPNRSSSFKQILVNQSFVYMSSARSTICQRSLSSRILSFLKLPLPKSKKFLQR